MHNQVIYNIDSYKSIRRDYTELKVITKYFDSENTLNLENNIIILVIFIDSLFNDRSI